MDGYNALEQIAMARHDYLKAYNCRKMYILYRDSLMNEENTKKIVQTQMQFDFDKKESAARELQDKKDILARSEKQNQKNILILVLMILVLLSVFSGFIFRALRVSNKQKKVIESQKRVVEEHQKDILDSIRYAKRIQTALLPTHRFIEKTLTRMSKI